MRIKPAAHAKEPLLFGHNPTPQEMPALRSPQTPSTRLMPAGPLEACAVRRQGLVVALSDHRRLDGRRRLVGTAGIAGGGGLVSDAEVDGPGGRLAGDFGGSGEGKIDARADARRRDHVAVLDDS